MKTLFFIAALAAAVFLMLQTPAGKSWLTASKTELVDLQQSSQKPQQKETKAQPLSTQIVQSVEKKVSELAQQLNQEQQVQINQLEKRIAELENELVMSRIAEKPQKQQKVSSGVVTLHPYKEAVQQTVEQVTAQPAKATFDVAAGPEKTLIATSHNQLQRKRQARLQDIAQKMEMSSLQALVN